MSEKTISEMLDESTTIGKGKIRIEGNWIIHPVLLIPKNE